MKKKTNEGHNTWNSKKRENSVMHAVDDDISCIAGMPCEVGKAISFPTSNY